MIRVGFVLTGQDWIGGLNYLRNLFSAIALLSKKNIQPVLFVGSRVPDEAIRIFSHVEIIRSSLLDSKTPVGLVRRGVNKISGGRDPFLRILLRRNDIDVLSHFGAQWAGGKIRKIGWIPDFQHVRLPNFFSVKERRTRDASFRSLIHACDCVLLSSNAALSDFAEFSPAMVDKSAVLPFVPDIDPSIPLSEILDLEDKYDFNERFFYIPNQFWIHKNHELVIDALSLLKARGITATVLLSGNTDDYRHPGHYLRLMAKVKACGVEESFKVLGTIPYKDLISLMHYSVALINPSLFEGWSSTVEEAKAIRKTILLSNIPVHVEQNPEKGIYFDPHNAHELAEKMESVLSKSFAIQAPESGALEMDGSYEVNRLEFAGRYQEIVEKVMSS